MLGQRPAISYAWTCIWAIRFSIKGNDHRSLEHIHLWHSSALPHARQEHVPLVLIDPLVKQTSYQLIRCLGWGGALKTAPVIEHWQHREQDKEVHP